MSPLRRRSARLCRNNAAPRMKLRSSPQLDPLVETNNMLDSGPQSNSDANIASPRTPSNAAQFKPPHHEMHPSHAHQSTAKKSDSALRLGFSDINDKNHGGYRTPSKVTPASPSFDFRFARPVPQLGPEAQRMMDELREEALRIKAKLVAEREEERHNAAAEDAHQTSNRKIARANSKVGRFSDAHMSEFKKMDSIAGHVSAFRGQPGLIANGSTSLKRSQSKAKLEDREYGLRSGSTNTGSLTRSKSNIKLDTHADQLPSHDTEATSQSMKLDSAAPRKRARQHKDSDVSSGRTISQDSKCANTTLPRSRSITQSISAPTQASLARAANLHRPATQIPNLVRSPSKYSFVPSLAKSAMTNNLADLTRSEPNRNFFSPSKFDRVKSILRSPTANPPKSDLASPSPMPPLSKKSVTLNLDKELPSLPTSSGSRKIAKHVNFTSDAFRDVEPTKCTSPVRSGIPKSKSSRKLDGAIDYPALSTETRYHDVSYVQYPSLSASLLRPQRHQEVRTLSPAPLSVPGTFTFRSDKTIKFGNSPHGFGSSPGQSSVRQVRQSIMTAMPGSFPSATLDTKEILPPPGSGGLCNKKRRRVSSDEENTEDVERAAKKHKISKDSSMVSKFLVRNLAPKSKTPSPTKKGVLSLSRLNILARPKIRK